MHPGERNGEKEARETYKTPKVVPDPHGQPNFSATLGVHRTDIVIHEDHSSAREDDPLAARSGPAAREQMSSRDPSRVWSY